jgi:hypothetical protein
MEGLSMAIAPILAMTAGEMRSISAFPGKIAWMACHFSPYGLGLSNLPKLLPAGSVLVVDDVTPPHGHDPGYIAAQLERCIKKWNCCGILLDFQRVGCDETKAIAEHLVEALPCHTVVSEGYARNLDCPVFLPPVPPSVPLEKHLASWKGREIWLELGLDGETLTLTEAGCEVIPLPHPDLDAQGFVDEELCCHYQIAVTEKSARFTLWRTKKDISKLVDEAIAFGITTTIGLYQELQ